MVVIFTGTNASDFNADAVNGVTFDASPETPLAQHRADCAARMAAKRTEYRAAKWRTSPAQRRDARQEMKRLTKPATLADYARKAAAWSDTGADDGDKLIPVSVLYGYAPAHYQTSGVFNGNQQTSNGPSQEVTVTSGSGNTGVGSGGNTLRIRASATPQPETPQPTHVWRPPLTLKTSPLFCPPKFMGVYWDLRWRPFAWVRPMLTRWAWRTRRALA